VAGIYPRVEEAMQAMGQGFDVEYRPNPALTSIYKKRYGKYKDLGAAAASSFEGKTSEPALAR